MGNALIKKNCPFLHDLCPFSHYQTRRFKTLALEMFNSANSYVTLEKLQENKEHFGKPQSTPNNGFSYSCQI